MAEPATPTAQPRRTQVQRSATTRAALLDAALECLVEFGYANTTTSRVAERAGLSRGAPLHHFQTRTALVAAAIEHYADRRGEELRGIVERMPEGRDRTGRSLDLLFELFCSPLFQGAVDLWAAARTDPELQASLAPLERRLARDTVVLYRLLFPAQADRQALMDLVLNAIRGVSLLDVVMPGTGATAKQWRTSRALLVGLLDAE
ncbi:MAG: TetR/AcrR family transcriptional regulator [Solirubrobacterales bacterium]|nr:TetR/AcrR family transcriptional regulator [Solirubrobacterales bacterium]